METKTRKIVLGNRKTTNFENGPSTPEVDEKVARVDFMLDLWMKGPEGYVLTPEDMTTEWKMLLLTEFESVKINNQLAMLSTLPEKVALLLTGSPHVQTRELLVNNPGLSVNVLQILTEDVHPDVAAQAKERIKNS